MVFEEHQLNNGLKILFIKTGSPSITSVLLVGAGSRYEKKENNGIAHFFEHMVFKGSKRYPSSFIISSTIEGLGAVFNAFTTKDHTGYWIKSTPDHFEAVVDVLSDMILNPLLAQEEIEREKGVIIEEINMYEDIPQRKVGEIFEELLYEDNPLGFNIAGRKETIASFRRENFIDYLNQFYHPENSIFVVAGNLELSKKKKYLKLIEEKFGLWAKGGEIESLERVIENQKKPQTLIRTKKTEQTHFCLGYRTFSFFDERRFALSILSAILGGGMSSRLFIELREKRGLCYYVSTDREHYSDTGNIVTQAGISTEEKKVRESIKIILDEHEKIKEKIDLEELNRVKEMIKGRFILSLEDTNNTAMIFGVAKLLRKKIDTPEEIIRKIEAVTIEEVKKLAQELFVPQKLNLVLIGPFDEKTVFLD
ncbi:MAG: insulinase family protein [Patescibacteria group bacterium]|nr:insulinase family protein [Patescibacteria group bacterium]